MANKHRGQVALEVDGVAYNLRLSVNSLCDLESILQGDLMAALERPDIRTVRAVIWAALSPDKPGLTLEGAGEIMDAVGFVEIANKVAELVNITFPKKEGEASTGNPQ